MNTSNTDWTALQQAEDMAYFRADLCLYSPESYTLDEKRDICNEMVSSSKAILDAMREDFQAYPPEFRSKLRTAGYKDHDSTFCRPRSKPHRPVMHGAPTTRAPCQSLAQDHSQPSSAMRLRMDSLPSMCIILELYTTRSMTASASAPSPMRSCQPDGPYCEQSISDPLR